MFSQSCVGLFENTQRILSGIKVVFADQSKLTQDMQRFAVRRHRNAADAEFTRLFCRIKPHAFQGAVQFDFRPVGIFFGLIEQNRAGFREAFAVIQIDLGCYRFRRRHDHTDADPACQHPEPRRFRPELRIVAGCGPGLIPQKFQLVFR